MIITWNRVTFVTFFEFTCINIDCINTNLQWIRFKVALESSKPMISFLKSKFELSKCWNLEHVGRRKPKKWHPLAKSWIFYEFYEFRESNYLRFRIPIKSKWKKKWKWRPIPWKNFAYNVWQEVLLASRWDFEWKGFSLWNSKSPVHHSDPTETNHTAPQSLIDMGDKLWEQLFILLLLRNCYKSEKFYS